MLRDRQLSDSFRQSLKKYLVISLVTSLEHFFRSEAKYMIDKNDMDTNGLFSGEMSFSVSDLDKMLKDGILTKGNIVASTFNFANLDDINHVLSKLLKLDFLDYVHKLNDVDQTRYVLDGHPIPIEYGKLKDAYKLRNEIVHELRSLKMSNSRILSLWDNIMNIMDISVSIFLSASDPNLRSSLDTDYQWGLEREKKKMIYKLYSQKIIKYLNEKGPMQLVKDGKLPTSLLNDVGMTTDDDILMDNFHWILKRMSREKVIRMLGDIVRLTSSGVEKAKKL